MSGSGISRVFLREDLIWIWNALVDDENRHKLNILTAASGFGKSIHLYLIAIFARHFGIPVQYVGNAGALLLDGCDHEFIASQYAAMLLFMNSSILDNLAPFHSGRPCYDFLKGNPTKFVVYYALIKGDHEHDALWQKLVSDPNTWLPFFELYARPVWYSTMYCKFVSATSQLLKFKLPNGYRNSKRYIEPLSKEEFKVWQTLDDYPGTFRDYDTTVLDYTGRVPGTIAELIELTRNFPNLSFEEVASRFYETFFADMQIGHSEYVKSLTDEVDKKAFYNMLYKLFLDNETPMIRFSDIAYRDRGLLIAMNDGSLHFNNSIARDILFESFSNYYFSKDRLVELYNKFKEDRMKGFSGSEYFEQLFLDLCYQFRPDIEAYSRSSHRKIHLNSNVQWLRFDGKRLMPPRSNIEFSCWIKFGANYPQLDYAYVDMTDGSWMLYLIQVFVSSFPVHNRDSAQLELLFEKTGGTVPLASLLNSFFDGPFEVSPVYDAGKKIVNFEVTDSQGISFRDRISILYVTPLTKEDAKVDSAPGFVEFLTFDNFIDDMKSFIDLGREVESMRVSRNQLPVKRTIFDET
ncbi:hypothetical protein GAYE_SCF25G4417 [Galdieria yellowstonensis]|uniref:Uncharacterized protein n=1 Tax=Galdieria yellowstonensis TaxID=3028027 RepID=A0AAV9IH26_9RHOD|nr:hypothetical protein GAYE_SCF25G4417 [Galdieria yellowstonensis]